MDPLDMVGALGAGQGYSVRSTSNPEHAHLVFWAQEHSHWCCSCPADHKRLRDQGRWCSTIAKAITFLSLPAAEPEQAKPVRHLHPIKGGAA